MPEVTVPGARLALMLRFIILTVLVALALTPAVRAGAESRPNVIVIVTDDHRADVLGCAGHPVVQTPHIDSLADRGIRFTNAFVTTSICAASRASILTGLVERTHRFTFGTPALARVHCDTSYPSRLRQHGYRTGFVGKLGLSVEGGTPTLHTMFDEVTRLHRTPYVKTRPDGSTRHVTDITGDAAIEFIQSVPLDTPFCLSVSFNAAHAEDNDLDDHYPPPATEASLYADVPMPRPRLDDPQIFQSLPHHLQSSMNRTRYLWRWDTPEKYDRNLRNYFRMVTGLDRNIGRIIAELRDRGRLENTVIVVIGDNGYYMGERGLAGKWSHYDESLRVPCILVDPRHAPEDRGRTSDAFVLNIDIAPTVIEAAGLAADDTMQGRPLPRLTGDEALGAGRDVYIEHRMHHPQIPRWEGLRTARYKYVRYLDVEGEPEYLYDLVADPDELTNLAGEADHASTLVDLATECQRRSRAYAAAGRPLPRVLMLGDSISMGYHTHVVNAMKEDALIVRPAENCAGTTKGLQHLAAWLQLEGGDFDVIHFNFGLHDLKRVKPTGKNSNDPSDPHQADLATYTANLRTIVEMLRETDATLVFATTTPVPSGVRPHRDPADVDRYNAAAIALMAEHDIAINDLNAFATPRLADLQHPRDVHFTRAGSRELGTAVVRSLRAALRR